MNEEEEEKRERERRNVALKKKLEKPQARSYTNMSKSISLSSVHGE